MANKLEISISPTNKDQVQFYADQVKDPKMGIIPPWLRTTIGYVAFEFETQALKYYELKHKNPLLGGRLPGSNIDLNKMAASTSDSEAYADALERIEHADYFLKIFDQEHIILSIAQRVTEIGTKQGFIKSK